MANNTTDLEKLRHSTAHLLAAAVVELWPKAKRAIGPAIENGFYFDFDFGDIKVSEADFPKIEAKMHDLVKNWKSFSKHELGYKDALKEYPGNEFKHELIEEFSKNGIKKLSFYKSGDYWDLCLGGHVVHPDKEIKNFKLLSVAGAYWRGSEKNKMLTRIYGTVFPSEKELNDYLQSQEEIKKRDHRKLGKDLNLYLFSDLVGPGLPLYKPKGAIIIGEIEKFMRELQTKIGYDHVYTPNIAKEDLFHTSGHLQWFKESMYPPMSFEGEGDYYAKPMNCPFHIEIYKSSPKSYKDLPVRYAEFGTVYRYEKSGEIGGLLRTRGFTQDDAHIFCREDQVVEEFIKVFDFTKELLTGLGLSNYYHRLSLKGDEKDKYAGNEHQWQKATELIRQALKKAQIKFVEAPGEAAFYGPKLDIIFKDSLDREWQISTIQIDFLLPERFDLYYIDEKGAKQQPYMIHRAPLGSRERIMATLIEHYAGNFPTWLTPVQVKVLPITDKQLDYAKEVKQRLERESIRVELDERNETLQAKIRDAQLEKVAYMLIIGNKEKESKTVSVRQRKGQDLGQQKLETFLKNIEKEIEKKIS